VTCLFIFPGWTDGRVPYLKIQRRLFRETGRELDIFFHRGLRPPCLEKRRGKREDLFVCKAMSVHDDSP